MRNSSCPADTHVLPYVRLSTITNLISASDCVICICSEIAYRPRLTQPPSSWWILRQIGTSLWGAQK
jgi:hypothetical protein